jgi:hypothetical protein
MDIDSIYCDISTHVYCLWEGSKGKVHWYTVLEENSLFYTHVYNISWGKIKIQIYFVLCIRYRLTYMHHSYNIHATPPPLPISFNIHTVKIICDERNSSGKTLGHGNAFFILAAEIPALLERCLVKPCKGSDVGKGCNGGEDGGGGDCVGDESSLRA